MIPSRCSDARSSEDRPRRSQRICALCSLRRGAPLRSCHGVRLNKPTPAPIKDRRRGASFRKLLSSPSAAIVPAVGVAVADRSPGTDRSSPRSCGRCRRFLRATRRAGCSRRSAAWCREGSTCSRGPFRSADPTGPRRPASPFPARCRGEDLDRPTIALPVAETAQASSRPSLANGSKSRIASRVEGRTRAEASRNWRRSCSRETDSSNSVSERRITSVLERALSRRLSRRTCACSAGARVNDDFAAVRFFMLLSYLLQLERCNAGARSIAGI